MPKYAPNRTTFDDSDTAALAAVTAEIQEFMSRPFCECCGVKRVYVHPDHGQHYLCKTCSEEQTTLADSMWT